MCQNRKQYNKCKKATSSLVINENKLKDYQAWKAFEFLYKKFKVCDSVLSTSEINLIKTELHDHFPILPTF